MSTALDLKSVAATNQAVDLKKLEELAQIRHKLASAGLVREAEYRLSPPLGKGTAEPEGQPTCVRLTQS